jgi:hypothetical protein
MIDALSQSLSLIDRGVNAPVNKLRETAGKIVGRVFYGTMLKMLRESGLKGKYGHGGRGEEVFSAQLHNIFAERMGQADGNPLTEAMVKAYLKQAECMNKDGRSQEVWA